MENKHINIVEKENLRRIKDWERGFKQTTENYKSRINNSKLIPSEQKMILIGTLEDLSTNHQQKNKIFFKAADAFYNRFDIWTKLAIADKFRVGLKAYNESVRNYQTKLDAIFNEIEKFDPRNPEITETPESELTKDEILKKIERQKQIYARWAREIKGTRGMIRKSYQCEMNLCSKEIERLEEVLKQKG